MELLACSENNPKGVSPRVGDAQPQSQTALSPGKQQPPVNRVLRLGSVEPYAQRAGTEFTPLSSVWKDLRSQTLAVGDLDLELGWLWFLPLAPRDDRPGSVEQWRCLRSDPDPYLTPASGFSSEVL